MPDRPSAWDPFAYGYRPPPGASAGHRIWAAAVLGLIHLGWWFGTTLHEVPDPERPSQEGAS
ncbi:hypothetical protein [Streptomyces avicenniae]|uniref:hypothetical protein n=1 Tax=Streptomyces avicenniae TaxID=500153 RepID=UPI00069A2739|nr:hypothetical protein [Streptomyces avicenniae]